MSKEWFKYSKEELLELPERDWGVSSSYRSVLFVSTRKKHDSGYSLFAMIGCKDGETPTEICGYTDDFRFDPYWGDGELSDTIRCSDIAFDCSMKGVFRMHSTREIHVGSCCSTTSWWLGKRL